MAEDEVVTQSILQDRRIVFKPSDSAVVSTKEIQAVPKEHTESANENAAFEITGQDQKKKLEEKVAQLNDYVQHLNRNLEFSIDEQSGDTIIKVIDAETKELVRQIPSQEIIDVRNAVDKYRGLLLKTKV
ncbi:MAG: flagellar protein FlaG [Piscirickettsiaceae bacterium]|nr:flagellar protein FlaG [Piscirickettsiaceae bacterium]